MSITGDAQHPAGDIINLTSSTTCLAFCVWWHSWDTSAPGVFFSSNICQGAWENIAHGERKAKYCCPRTIFSHHGFCLSSSYQLSHSIGGTFWGLVVECLSRKHRTLGLVPITENIRIEEGEGREEEHAGRMA